MKPAESSKLMISGQSRIEEVSKHISSLSMYTWHLNPGGGTRGWRQEVGNIVPHVHPYFDHC